MRFILLCFVWPVVSVASLAGADDLEVVAGVEAQPLKAQAKRIEQVLQFLGEPLDATRQAELDAACHETDDAAATLKIQRILDPLCIAGVQINPESRVKVAVGPAQKQLAQHGWRVFLVKVHNQGGITPRLRATSPHAAPPYQVSTAASEPRASVSAADVANRWLDVQTFDHQPLNRALSGLEIEYRVVQIYSRESGKREATIGFDVGQGTQDLGFRNEIAILFDCLPATKVVLNVLDTDGQPTMGQFVFRDHLGRVYPARSRRLAPDFFFHDQVYREAGEHVLLPPGRYDVTFSRGPEYAILNRQIEVPEAAEHAETFRLARWIKLADFGWYSGDHHVHAAGCAHYEAPTQGVGPADMMRHIRGEDLNVGCVLSWGPCWYHQKEFFNGQVHTLSTPDYLMRYDIEVSGFPSSHAGHLCLLNLREDDYVYPEPADFEWNYEGVSGRFVGTKTERIGEWPSWTLPVLQWGKSQGGVVGFSHSGWGLQVPGDQLPNYNLPAFDGIGANEYIVDVVHGACDFISAVDTPIIWELNIWYHTLNCGFNTRISGETDFPCIYGERVGLGRSYVKIPPGQPLDYETWIHGIRDGRSYCGDGLSHLFDYQINGLGVGEPGDSDRPSVLAVRSGESLKVNVRAAALLDEQPRGDIHSRSLDQQPYWHVERARVGDTRKVPVELIVNGQVVARKEFVADGSVNDVEFEYAPEKSSWIALRIFPSCHTNPIFVELDEQPIRASRRSAQWCLDAVDVCWNAKRGMYRAHELTAAKAAYETARQTYRRILAESHDDTDSAHRTR